MKIPDYISPVVGYRVWVWDAAGLRSLNAERWLPGLPLSALCRADRTGSIAGLSKATHNPNESPYLKCTCGVYAAKTIEHLRQCGYRRFGVHGEVYLWGRVVEHERGWRAQFAYPKSFSLKPYAIPFKLSEIESRLKSLIAFGTDIFIIGKDKSICLWKNGSGFDPAGLDYIIKMSNEYYDRHREERTLKKGDRVALLAGGVAVVEQAGEKQVHVLLRNAHALRIRRSDVIWDQQNMRWECKALLEEQCV